MNTCRVLRCDKPVDDVHVRNADNAFARTEYPVCQDHAARLAAGEPRAYQRDENTFRILMGSDVEATGDEFVYKGTVTQDPDLVAPDGTFAVRVLLETRRRGSDRPGFIEFMASEKVAENLGRALLRGRDPNADQV